MLLTPTQLDFTMSKGEFNKHRKLRSFQQVTKKTTMVLLYDKW